MSFVSLDNQRQINRFKKIEARCIELLPVKKLKGKRPLKALYEKDNFTSLYLKINKDQVEGIKPEEACLLNGKITFSAIYLGDKEKGYRPSIVIRVSNDVSLKPTQKRSRKDDDSAISDSDSDEDEDAPAISDSSDDEEYIFSHVCD